MKINKKGLSDTNTLEWIKIVIILTIGYIIIKALLSIECPECVKCVYDGVIHLN